MDTLLRKTRRTYNEPGHAHYLTFSCYRGLRLLSRDAPRRWFIEALAKARDRHAFDVHAYVIMPEHVHLLVRPRRATYQMGMFLKAVKRPVSWNAKQQLRPSGNVVCLKRLTVRKGARSVFRFWEAGGGFDRNLWSNEALKEAVAYIHANPVRKGLVERPTDWPWSSARFWAGLDGVLLPMDPIPA